MTSIQTLITRCPSSLALERDAASIEHAALMKMLGDLSTSLASERQSSEGRTSALKAEIDRARTDHATALAFSGYLTLLVEAVCKGMTIKSTQSAQVKIKIPRDGWDEEHVVPLVRGIPQLPKKLEEDLRQWLSM